MQRLALQHLIDWLHLPERMPILLRGARQVGKSYLIDEFGKQHFKSYLKINFELQREYISCFASLDPKQILNTISAISRISIIPGETLLFLDEIQECPTAIQALRYFKENLPELHVIGAGSLLEFTLNQIGFRMPVGRIQPMYLKPLSFKEYCLGAGFTDLIEILDNTKISKPLSSSLHKKFTTLLREYMIVGGMPAIASYYIAHRNLVQCQVMQSALLGTYQNDFGKYARQTAFRYHEKLLQQSPGIIGQHFKYAKIDPDIQSRELKQALQNLIDAGILYKVHACHASGLPLQAGTIDKKFKIIFLDIGLVKSSYFIDAQLLLKQDLMLINQGKLVEQFVGQELLAYGPHYTPGELFYWDRDKKGSQAEVDYVIQHLGQIFPLEVKAGQTGTLRSLRQFIEEKHSLFGIRLSLTPLSFQNKILSVPLYMISQLPRIIGECL